MIRRRGRRWGRLTVSAVGLCVLGACGTQPAPADPAATMPPATMPPLAEVAESGPDCLADDVVTSISLFPQDTGSPGPTPGAVPPDFQPAGVVLCRISMTTMLQEPAPPTLVPRIEDLGADEPLPDVPVAEEDADVLQRLTIEEVTLTGDVDPFLAALARESAPRSSGACMAKMEVQPAIFLVDDDGRAVRPQWPVDGCGFLLEGAAATLEGLTETGVTVHEVDQCVGRCSTAEGG